MAGRAPRESASGRALRTLDERVAAHDDFLEALPELREMIISIGEQIREFKEKALATHDEGLKGRTYDLAAEARDVQFYLDSYVTPEERG